MPPLTENDVLDHVTTYLSDRGFSSRSVPAGKQGHDLVAEHPDGQKWVIEAKGATSSRAGSPREGEPFGSGVAFNRVAQAFLTAVTLLQHPELQGARIGIAIPSTPWLDIQSAKIETACKLLGISIFRVSEDGTVTLLDNPADASLGTRDCRVPRTGRKGATSKRDPR